MARVRRRRVLPLAPDWVCEILSPSTSRLDRAQKLAIYAREGVAHACSSTGRGTLEVLRLEHARWTILATRAGRTSSAPSRLPRSRSHSQRSGPTESGPGPTRAAPRAQEERQATTSGSTEPASSFTSYEPRSPLAARTSRDHPATLTSNPMTPAHVSTRARHRDESGREHVAERDQRVMTTT